MVYFLRKVKDIHLLYAPKREEEKKIFNYQEGLRRKTSFVFKIFALQKNPVHDRRFPNSIYRQ